jgi:large subunit ribosomal protein L10
VLTRAQKEESVAELNEKFSRATSVFVANYRGLAVSDVNALRGELRKASSSGDGNEYQVAKNSLLRRAAKGLDAELLDQHFTGPTAIAIGYGDPVGLAKVLVQYAEKHEVFQIKGAVLDGKALGKEEVAKLATLPSLLELRSRLVGLLVAPATKMARLLKEPGAQLARVVAARKDALEK